MLLSLLDDKTGDQRAVRLLQQAASQERRSVPSAWACEQAANAVSPLAQWDRMIGCFTQNVWKNRDIQADACCLTRQSMLFTGNKHCMLVML